jgi:ABC-type multidrug transport system fused ATPase/permease subunit
VTDAPGAASPVSGAAAAADSKAGADSKSADSKSPDSKPANGSAAAAAGAGAGASAAGGSAKAAHSGALTKAETRQTGRIGSQVYVDFSRAAGGVWVIALLLAMFSAHQAGRVGGDWWLALWTADSLHASITFYMGPSEAQEHRRNECCPLLNALVAVPVMCPLSLSDVCAAIFSALGGFVALNSFIRSCFFALSGLRASFALHMRMLNSVLRSPPSWFDTTPTGQILNRFSSDIDKADHMLIRVLEGWGGCVFFVIGTFVAICVVYPYAAAPLLSLTAAVADGLSFVCARVFVCVQFLFRAFAVHLRVLLAHSGLFRCVIARAAAYDADVGLSHFVALRRVPVRGVVHPRVRTDHPLRSDNGAARRRQSPHSGR